MNTIWKHEVAK